MDWIPALLKQLSIARSAIGAVFITALILYVGPRVAPTYIEQVPKEWAAVPIAALSFSGCLLIFWGFAAAWSYTKRGAGSVAMSLRSSNLSHAEMAMLLEMGKRPNEALDLDRWDGHPMRLEVEEIANKLARLGLVRVNPYSSALISLSEKGKARALAIERASKEL